MEDKQIIVRKAARALDRAGLVNAYGHCSVRLDKETFLVCKAGPMGNIKPGEGGTVVPVEGPLPEGVLGEVRVHQQIYRRRPEINAVCRVLPPNVMALSALGVTPKARHGFSAFFSPEVPFYNSPALMRSDEVAGDVAATMGNMGAVIMRGNGCVTAGENMMQAVTLAWYVEDSARVELAALASGRAGTAPLFTEEEARARAVWTGNVAERMWEYLTRDDPE